jgi:hypothetical protein
MNMNPLVKCSSIITSSGKVPPVLFLNVVVPALYVAPVTNISVNADILNVPPVLFVKV